MQDCFDLNLKDSRNRPVKSRQKQLLPNAVPTIADPETYVEVKPKPRTTKRPASLEAPRRVKKDHMYAKPSTAMPEAKPEDPKDLQIKALEEELQAVRLERDGLVSKNKAIAHQLEQYKALFHKEQQDIIVGLKKKTVWSDKLVELAAHLRYLSGDTAYNFIREDLKIPLPTVRCLNQRLEDLKVKPGFNEDSFKLLSISAKKLEPEEKFAVLVMDEMSIKPAMEWDPTHKYMSGFNTLPEHDEEVPVDDNGEHLNVYFYYRSKTARLGTKSHSFKNVRIEKLHGIAI